SDPITLTYGGKLLSERSELRIAADLEKLPWMKLKGRFEGTLLLKPGEKFPIATIRAAGTDVGAAGFQAGRVEFAGEFDWPRVEGLELQARIGTNGLVALSGSANLESRVLGPTSLRVEGPIGKD